MGILLASPALCVMVRILTTCGGSWGDYENQILAVSTTNNHYSYFKGELLNLLKFKSVGVVIDRKVQIPLSDVTWYTCKPQDAASDADALLDQLGEHDYYLLTAGAASRYLAAKLHERGKSALDVGSMFDPEKGRPLRAHVWISPYKNSLRHCAICNY